MPNIQQYNTCYSPSQVFYATLADYNALTAQGLPVRPGCVVIDMSTTPVTILGISDGAGNLTGVLSTAQTAAVAPVTPVLGSVSAAAANTALIQAALNAVNALTSGGVVRVTGAGTAYVNASLVVYSNTQLILDDALTLRLAPSSYCTMIVNYAYTQARATIAALTSSGTTVTMQSSAAHGLSIGQWVSIHGAGGSGYNGVYQVLTVADSTHITYNAEILPYNTTATVASRYANMTFIAADTNIRISGGTLNPDTTNNATSNGAPSGCAIILAHIFNYEISNQSYYNCGTRNIYPFNARSGVIRKTRCDLTRVHIQTNGAIHGLHIYDASSIGTDDGIAIMAREFNAYSNVQLSEGDVLNVVVDGGNIQHQTNALTVYNAGSYHTVDGIVFSNVYNAPPNPGNPGNGISLYGVSGQVSSARNIQIRNCGIGSVLAQVSITYITIEKLDIDGMTFNPTNGTVATQGIFFGAGSAVTHCKVKNLRSTGWTPSSVEGLIYNNNNGGFNVLELEDCILNGGANALLLYMVGTGKSVTMRNCIVQGGARLHNSTSGGTLDLLSINDCRAEGSTNSLSLGANVGNLHFNGYTTSSGTNAMSVSAITTTITGGGFNFNGMTPVNASGSTINLRTFELPVNLTNAVYANSVNNFGTHAGSTNNGPCVNTGSAWQNIATAAAPT